MKTRTFLFVRLVSAGFAAGLGASAARADNTSITPYSGAIVDGSDDLFQNASISEWSPLYSGFSVGDMFGATNSAIEPGDVIFSDSYPPNTNFNVIFNDSAVAGNKPLTGFNLFIADDSQPAFDNGSTDNNRGISDFQLFSVTNSSKGTADSSGTNIQLADVTVKQNYYKSYEYLGQQSSVLEISGTFANPVYTHLFQAYFYSDDQNLDETLYGSRVMELQGISSPVGFDLRSVPLPAAALGGTALLAMIGLTRMSRRRLMSPA